MPYDVELCLIKIAELNKHSEEKDWMRCLDLLEAESYSFYLCHTYGNVENSMFPSKCWTFQHHCAQYSAPKTVVERMLELGFPLTLRDGMGKLPIDLVDSNMPGSYRKLFKPKKNQCSKLTLEKLEKMDKIVRHIMKERCGNAIKALDFFVYPVLSTYFERLNFDEKDDDFFLAQINENMTFFFEPEYSEDQSDVDAIIMSMGLNIKYRITENTYELIECVFP